MSAVHVVSVQMVHFCNCGECGVPIYGPEQVYRSAKLRERGFHCINGHAREFVGQTEEQKLRKELEEKERQLAAARAREQMARNNERSARHGAAIAKGKLKAQLERIQNGVCPCCNRSFQNVRRHMASKHPDALDRLKADEGGAK